MVWRLDPHGYHALVCKKTGLKVKRHNGLREVFLDLQGASRRRA